MRFQDTQKYYGPSTTLNRHGWLSELLNSLAVELGIVLICVALSACQLPPTEALLPPNNTATIDLQSSSTFSTITPTASSTITATANHEPTITSSATNTKTPSPTNKPSPTITNTPTYGPSPTMTSTPWDYEYGREKIIDLYQTNGNCRLPCWWGITPGKTTLSEVRQSFKPYVEADAMIIEPSGYGVVLAYPPPHTLIDYWLSTLLEHDRSETITVISLDGETALYGGFDPSYLLDNYGTPENIWLAPGLMIMFYENQHILTEYAITEDQELGLACLGGFNRLYTWAPEINWTEVDVRHKLDIHEWSEWEDATGQNIQAFRQAFHTFVGTENCFHYIPSN